MQLQRFTGHNIHTKIFNELHHLSGNYNKDVMQILTETNSFVAGGFALWTLQQMLQSQHPTLFVRRPSDIDIFFHSEEDFKKALSIAVITNSLYGGSDIEESPYMGETVRAVTYRSNGQRVQLIRLRYGTPEEILSTFDFELCKVYFQMDKISGKFELFNSSVVPFLCVSKSVKYTQSEHLIDDVSPDMDIKPIRLRLERLHKYLIDVNSFYDEESKVSLLQDLFTISSCLREIKKFNTLQWDFIGIYKKLLNMSNFTAEDAVLFITLGPLFREAFGEHPKKKI